MRVCVCASVKSVCHVAQPPLIGVCANQHAACVSCVACRAVCFDVCCVLCAAVLCCAVCWAMCRIAAKAAAEAEADRLAADNQALEASLRKMMEKEVGRGLCVWEGGGLRGGAVLPYGRSYT